MSYATNTDILHAVDGVRQDLAKQGQDIARLAAEQKRLADAHNDHERRLREFEGNNRSLIECNNAILHRLDSMAAQHEGLVSDITHKVEQSLRVDLLGTRTELRLEMLRTREAVEHLTKTLKERPCVLGEDCPEQKG